MFKLNKSRTAFVEIGLGVERVERVDQPAHRRHVDERLEGARARVGDYVRVATSAAPESGIYKYNVVAETPRKSATYALYPTKALNTR